MNKYCLKEICYHCRKEIDVNVISQRNEKIHRLFGEIIEDGNIEIIKEHDSETAKKACGIIFLKIICSDNFGMKVKELDQLFYTEKIFCSNCGNEINYNPLSEYKYSLFSNLQDCKLNYLKTKLKEKYGYNAVRILETYKSTYYELRFLEQDIDALLPEEKDNLKQLNERISVFYYGNGRGGDEFPFIQIAYDFLSNEFVKNAIYDLLKSGGLLIFALVIRRIKRIKLEKKVIKNISADMNKVVEFENANGGKSDIMAYLSEKDRKIIIKKIVKRISKEKMSEILHAKNEHDDNESAQ
jgi:hypothetical protein